MMVPASKKGKKKGSKIAVLQGTGAYSFKDIAGAAKSAVQAALKNKDTRSMLINGAGSLADRFVPGSRGTAQGLAKFLLNKVSGNGDYTIGGTPRTNSLFKQNKSGELAEGNALSIPKMHNSGNSIRISHREFVCDIIAPDDGQQFNPLIFTVNPGDPTVFPWLSNIAQLFEQYKFHGLVFEFVSTTSPYNNSPAMGYVMMAAQYNVLQAPFQSPIELENSTDSIMARPDHCLMYGVECQTQSYNYYYVRNNRNVIIDPATYDFVDITLATKGLPSTFVPGSVIGQMWISFDIELVQPIYELPAGGSCILAGNTANNVIGNFLAPFDSTINSGLCNLNYNGRFTPTSLNGNGKALFSMNKFNDANGVQQSRLIVELSNMEIGNGILVQLTLQGNSVSQSTPVSMTTGSSPSYGTAVIVQTTPSFHITGMANCELGNFDPQMPTVQQAHANEVTTVRGQLTPNVTLTIQAGTTSTNGKLLYTYTWYVLATGSGPGFIIEPTSPYNSNNVMIISGAAYHAQVNMTLIKNTTSTGLPSYIPYTMQPGVAPTSSKPNYANSMIMNRSFTQKYVEEQSARVDDRTLLYMLAEKHGLSLTDVHPDQHRIQSDHAVVEDHDFDVIEPPTVPKLKGRSLSFSTSF